MGLDSGNKLERNYSLFIKRYLLVFLIDFPPSLMKNATRTDTEHRREIMIGSFIFDTWYHEIIIWTALGD